MLFTDLDFLFLFLPIVLALAFLADRRESCNALLLLASIYFYASGEGIYVIHLLLSVVFNWAATLAMVARPSRPWRRSWMAAIVAVNLLALGYFKYGILLLGGLNALLRAAGHATLARHAIHLPIGISFYTFHSISYVVDVYRDDAPPARNPTKFGLYITLFPQLVAGPIVRYKTVADQINHRRMRLEHFAEGIRRFITGLTKKLLIADVMATVADRAFTTPAETLGANLAWLGLVCYTLQIYLDFSGYSDMAIGMGRMLGFRFPENFRYPYYAQSITEFWRRWHISLSTWFRDYLYIPLGGNRVGRARLYANLLIVFALCGLWHGASLTFVAWGLWHGLFLVAERAGLNGWLKQMPRPIRHFYALAVVMAGWVLFRGGSFGDAQFYLRALAGGGAPSMPLYLTADVIAVMVAGAVFSTPVTDWIKAWWVRQGRRAAAGQQWIDLLGRLMTAAGMAAAFLFSASAAAARTHVPFIYFRF